MDIFSNSNRLLKLFVEFLGAGQNRTSLSKEVWSKMEEDFGETVYPDLLYLLTQKDFSIKEAREHWSLLLDHQEKLNESLGRDVGFQVALCDYFTNIHQMAGNLVLVDVKTLLRKERSTLLDELTGLYSQRYLERMLKRELDRSERYKLPFTLMILHIDHLNTFYEMNGRKAGDALMASLAELLVRTGRTIDYAARYNDEDFVIILPNCNKSQAANVAERHQKSVYKQKFNGEDALPGGVLTMSIGYSVYPVDAKTGPDLLDKAADALDKALRQGVNKINSSPN